MSCRVVALLLVTLMIAGVGVAGDKPWFDMENCAMCKNMASYPKLMENVSWEQHSISKGILCVTTVKEKYLDDYRAAHAEMEKSVLRLQKGEALEMCGSCIALGQCFMKGAIQEYVETSTGDVWIVTSDNPEVVTELQSWAKRSKEEMAMIESKEG